MKWALIIWTFYAPNVPVKAVEIFYSSESSCLEGMAEIERMYTNVEHDSFGYKLECRER